MRVLDLRETEVARQDKDKDKGKDRYRDKDTYGDRDTTKTPTCAKPSKQLVTLKEGDAKALYR